MENNSIGNYEPRQIWKEAAINSEFLCGLFSIEKLTYNLREEKTCHIQHYTENLDH